MQAAAELALLLASQSSSSSCGTVRQPHWQTEDGRFAFEEHREEGCTMNISSMASSHTRT